MLKFNNDFSKENIGQEILFKGWVSRVRDLGGLLFIDLRDRSGIIQVVVKPENPFYELAETLRSEYVIEVVGKIIERENKNLKIKNGDIEVELDSLKLLNKAEDLPFDLNNTTALEDTRLKYRYLDIRREEIKNNLILRHKVTSIIRNYLNSLEFLEIETPILTKSTPEGARDYLVPSRVQKGEFYALPQSPQLFKQLLMVGGIERYYQIAKCFRDEDLRADRQPEFTQLDMELSFITEKDIMDVTEGLFKQLFKELLKVDVTDSFDKITYHQAIDLYGSDKPDLRFGMIIKDLKEVFEDTKFELFKVKNETFNCLVIEENISRKKQDELTEFVNRYGLEKLYFLKYETGQFTGSLVKNLDEKELSLLEEKLILTKDATIIIAKDSYKIVKKALGALRLKLGKEFDLIEKGFKPLWVVNFPLLEYDEDAKRYVACHHPFTSPLQTNIEYLDKPEECLAKAYDFVINGYEVGGGSIRISDSELQEKMFKTLGFRKKETEEKFGFLIEAFKYGVPPHGGIAFGLERIVMIFAGTENIRDVIAFPKTASATCLMTDAPNKVSDEQLKELKISIKS